jgi:hypothetical protein
MIDILADAKARLLDDAPLVTLAAGGIYTAADLGAGGLNRTALPGTAFDAHLRIKPLVYLKLRDPQPDYEAADDAGQIVSTQAVIEAWLYEFAGYTAIQGMANRIYAAFHGRQLPATLRVSWDGDVRPPIRDEDLDATFQRTDYRVRLMRRPVTAQ